MGRQRRRRSLLAILLAASAVLAACAGPGPAGETSTGPGAASDAGGPPAGSVDGDEETPDNGRDAEDSHPAGDSGAPQAPPASGAEDDTNGRQVAPGPGRDLPDGRGPPGSFAPVLLRPSPAATVVVELLIQPGADPRAGNLDHVASVLRQVTGKTVRIAGPVPVASETRSWSPDDIRAAADSFGVAAQGGEQAVIRLLFLRGGFLPDDRVLGVAVRGDVAAVFMDRVRSTGTPLVGASAIEDAVTMHETGHLLGLVDLFLRTGREDPEHPGHSRNPESVMYWAVQTTLVIDVLGGGPPRDFDDDDLADLAAIRAGAGA